VFDHAAAVPVGLQGAYVIWILKLPIGICLGRLEIRGLWGWVVWVPPPRIFLIDFKVIYSMAEFYVVQTLGESSVGAIKELAPALLDSQA